MAKRTKDSVLDEYKTLTPREHILLRSGMYLGTCVETMQRQWVLDDDGHLVQRDISYVPALLKIISEVLDNSIDAGIKTGWKKSNRIDLKISGDKVSVKDNGTGIPVQKNEKGEWIPVICFCTPMTGSNFDDDSKGIGTNGIGVKAANIFSKEFRMETCDGAKRLKLVCRDNMSTQEFKTEDAPGIMTGTTVSFTPDLKRFGVSEISGSIITLLRTRLRILSWFYPKCSFTLNGEKLGIKAKEFQEMLPGPAFAKSDDTRSVIVYPSEDPEVLTYVNGISMPQGGSQVAFMSDFLVAGIREKLARKYKSIKPGDIRNRLGLVIFMKEFPNCKFDSQTKEKLGNPVSDVKAFFEGFDMQGLLNKVLGSSQLMDHITEFYRAKEMLKEEKAVKQASGKKQISSDKYYPPISGTKKKYLLLTEGASAFGGISRILGRKEIGYYCLKGKVLNPEGMTMSKIMANQEVSEIVGILGLDLTGESAKMQYEHVVVLSDADMDGIAICSLVVNLFNRLNPKVVESGALCRLNTPLLIGLSKDKVMDYHYEFPDSSKLKKRLDYKYIKGLGSWEKDWLAQVIAQEGGIENMLIRFQKDEDAQANLGKWFGSDTSGRKTELAGKEFHIDMV